MSKVKYKCKKSYPGGPVVGHILNPQETSFAGMNYWWNNVWFDPNDYSEYWGLVREPIFTTEDGVELKYGDLFYTTNTKYQGETWTCMPVVISETFFNPHIYKNSFSTAQKCYAWIEENKPQYSKKDMLSFGKKSFSLGCKSDYICTIEELLKNFKK